ncbi:MAG: flagellar biosynthesis anti-sigma factor FlgM [Bdellovibrionaceae bacterium]|nr:flagellar biosynthesis anti-sigma factor FlgM [Pseudobdellovibrionaceae bacterium]
MKITHNKVGQNLNLSDSVRTDKSKEKSAVEGIGADKKTSEAKDVKDLVSSGKFDAAKLDLSERAQDIRKAKEMAQSTPDVDMDKVDKFRKLIDEGKYKVDAKAVADRMVSEGLMNLGQANND